MKNNYDDYLREEKPFNMAIMFLTRLDNRLNERDGARIEGNIIKWFRSLRSIYTNIYFKVKEAGHEKEEEELNKLFKKVENLLSIQINNNPDINSQIQGIAIGEVEKILDSVDLKLNTLMYEYGLIFPKKKFLSIEEEIEGDY